MLKTFLFCSNQTFQHIFHPFYSNISLFKFNLCQGIAEKKFVACPVSNLQKLSLINVKSKMPSIKSKIRCILYLKLSNSIVIKFLKILFFHFILMLFLHFQLNLSQGLDKSILLRLPTKNEMISYNF